MKLHNRYILYCFGFLLLLGCVTKPDAKPAPKAATPERKNTNIAEVKPKKEDFVLTDDNAIPFFFEYAKKNLQNRLKIETDYGSFVIELSEKTPYHRANFIYLTKEKYFDGTFFHRVVPDFIIQGGNSDHKSTSEKRRRIGKYLLPPDTRNGLRHQEVQYRCPAVKSRIHIVSYSYEFLSHNNRLALII